MTIREVIENSIKEALLKLKVNPARINLEHPENLSFGDYSSNAAMVSSKESTQNPRQLAELIVAEIRKKKPKEVEKIEVAGPGFINFFLSPEFFRNEVKEILKNKNKFGTNKNLKGTKTIIEYTDPNPFKEFHIGHLMDNAIGESISRITEANGAKVKRVCYQGDVGLHVAKTIWAIKKSGKLSKSLTAHDLGQFYAKGVKAYDEDTESKKEITELNRKIYERSDKEINNIYDFGRKVSLKYFDEIYKILGTKFDENFFESKTSEMGKEIVLKNLDKVFEKSEGAIIFKGEDHGLHTRVFINSEGLPTYEAKELGLSKIKYDKTKYDRSVIVAGNDIREYFKVLLRVMSMIFPDLAEKTHYVSHGMLRLDSGKMSSRTGEIISALSLISDVKNKVLEKMKDSEVPKAKRDDVAMKVAVGALKYSILKQVSGKDIIFDFDRALSFEGDSGPYLQYSYARAKSILNKAKIEKIKGQTSKPMTELTELEKNIYRFPEVVERAGREFAPHYIASYLIELASQFNNFYANGKIVDKKDSHSSYKIALTEAFSIVIKNGLNLLGIEVLERM